MLTAQVAPANDDDPERRVRLLLLGKAAVLAHRFERPLAAGVDEMEQWPNRRKCPNPTPGGTPNADEVP
jgi:hypothetical protein